MGIVPGLHLPQRRGQTILFVFAIGLEQIAPSIAHYQKILREHGLNVSMSGKGNCYDNSAVKSFFKSHKAELIWRRSWQTRRDVEVALFEYINSFYNPRRRHSVIGWKSPVAFEERPLNVSTWSGTNTRQTQLDQDGYFNLGSRGRDISPSCLTLAFSSPN